MQLRDKLKAERGEVVHTHSEHHFPVDALQNTIFATYEEAFAGRNETCPSYRFAELLVAIGAQLGRGVALVGHGRPLYPNFYCALVGPTYFGKKSESTQYNTKLRCVEDTELLILTSLSSPEGLIFALQEHNEDGARLLLLCDELQSLYIKFRQSGSEGLRAKLTEAYYAQDKLEVRTRHDPLVAYNPTISIMGNMTPIWFQESVLHSDVKGGFANRFIYIDHEMQELMYETEDPDTDKLGTVMETVRSVCRSVCDHPTRYFRMGTDAKQFAKAKYHDFNTKLLDADEIVLSAASRNFEHFHKLCLVFAVFENNVSDHDISLYTAQRAWQIAEYLFDVKSTLFQNLFANQQAERSAKVKAAIKQLGSPTMKSDISRKIGAQYMAADELAKILRGLLEMEEIYIDTDEFGKGTLIYLKEDITDR